MTSTTAVLLLPSLDQCEVLTLRTKSDGLTVVTVRDRDKPREFGDGAALLIDGVRHPFQIHESKLAGSLAVVTGVLSQAYNPTVAN